MAALLRFVLRLFASRSRLEAENAARRHNWPYYDRRCEVLSNSRMALAADCSNISCLERPASGDAEITASLRMMQTRAVA